MSTNSEPQGTVRLWRPAGLEGVEVLHGSDEPGATPVFYPEQYIVASNPRDHFEFWYRGTTHLGSDRMIQVVEAGEVARVLRQLAPSVYHFLFLDPEVVRSAARELGAAGEPHFARCNVEDPSAFRVLHRFHRSVADGSPPLAQQTLLTEALRLLLERYAEQRPARTKSDRPAVRRAREYLHAHWNESVDLNDLARAAYLSKYELVRQFRYQVGLPPHQYLLQLRIARARRMLARGVSISRAAMECGFSAQSHLHRHFVRSVGVTPGQYRSATLVKT